MKKIYFALYIGFYAGLIWALVRWCLYWLQFTNMLPTLLLKPFFTKQFMHSWIGHALGICVFILFSIVVSLIYAIFLSKRKGPWPGICYGIVWWVMVYVIVGPLTMVQPLWKLDLNTILCDACIFPLWGVFIGYSITLEFTDIRNYEPQAS